jgi:hypothetical protein
MFENTVMKSIKATTIIMKDMQFCYWKKNGKNEG